MPKGRIRWGPARSSGRKATPKQGGKRVLPAWRPCKKPLNGQQGARVGGKSKNTVRPLIHVRKGGHSLAFSLEECRGPSARGGGDRRGTPNGAHLVKEPGGKEDWFAIVPRRVQRSSRTGWGRGPKDGHRDRIARSFMEKRKETGRKKNIQNMSLGGTSGTGPSQRRTADRRKKRRGKEGRSGKRLSAKSLEKT